MNTNGNALAYPLQSDGVSHGSEPGLTKREAFAMAAMQGILANPTGDPNYEDAPGELFPRAVALMAANFADALLAELAKEPTP